MAISAKTTRYEWSTPSSRNWIFSTRLQGRGPSCYRSAVLLKLYIYGYLNLIQSSRRLEREAQRNVELMWLTGRLAPDFKTIADFRHDNGAGICNVCKRFVGMCRQLKLFTQAIVAIDGSKFKAVNSRDRNVTPAKIDARQRLIEQSIQRYLDALETADRTQPAEVEAKTERLQDKIKRLREQMRQLDETKASQSARSERSSRSAVVTLSIASLAIESVTCSAVDAALSSATSARTRRGSETIDFFMTCSVRRIEEFTSYELRESSAVPMPAIGTASPASITASTRRPWRCCWPSAALRAACRVLWEASPLPSDRPSMFLKTSALFSACRSAIRISNHR